MKIRTGHLTDWTSWGAGISAQLLTTPASCHSGSNCLQLSNSTSGQSGDSDTQTISLTVGQTVTMSGWVYQQAGANGGAAWQMGVYAVNGGQNGALIYVVPSATSVLGSWVYQTGSYTVPTWAECPCSAMLYTQLDTGSQLNTAVFDDGSMSTGTPNGTSTSYYVEDMLGTSRVITQNNGTVCYDADYDPYGGEHPYTNTCPQNYKFEGKERDTETGNDDFGARYYTERFGRWLSSDWSSVPVAVPYANLTNPQTLNLYAMVSDDPESFADLDGHEPLPSGSCSGVQTASSCGANNEPPPNPSGAQTLNQQQQAAAAQQQAQNQNQQTRANVAATAEKYNGRTDWAFAAQKGAFACNTNKCNEFVGDVTKEAGAPVSVTGSDGNARYPLASELADKNTKIANWRVLGKDETPQAGDIAAYKMSGGGTSFSGHSGIVTSVDPNGTVHAMAAHDKVIGPDNKFNPGVGAAVITYRRFTGDQ
ncbi:MAG: RHS repeat-associated core domain-containing protein [Candidatus Acidiferrum sp.]